MELRDEWDERDGRSLSLPLFPFAFPLALDLREEVRWEEEDEEE